MIMKIDERRRIATESLILDDLELNDIIKKITSVAVDNEGIAKLTFEVDNAYVNKSIDK